MLRRRQVLTATRSRVSVCLLITSAVLSCSTMAWAQQRDPKRTKAPLERERESARVVVSALENGIPTRLNGELGALSAATMELLRTSAQSGNDPDPGAEVEVLTLAFHLAERHLGARGDERFALHRVHSDENDGLHLRLRQWVGKVPVRRAELVLHVDVDGAVASVNGRFARASSRDASSLPLSGQQVMSRALKSDRVPRALTRTRPILGLERVGSEALWVYRSWVLPDEPEAVTAVEVVADAETGAIVDVRSGMHEARNRFTFNARGQWQMPGDLVMTEPDIFHGDFEAVAVHANAANAYDYFLSEHGRDSFDGRGTAVQATYNFGSLWNNAMWCENGIMVGRTVEPCTNHMIFGHGLWPNGSTYPWGRAADIVAHEFTHGVILSETALGQSGEEGAIGESLADIFGVLAERYFKIITRPNYRDDQDPDLWLFGEEINPRTSTDPLYGLRSLADPDRSAIVSGRVVKDGCAWYPHCYSSTSTTGIHDNAGIGNLVFHLLVEGGVPPRSLGLQPVTALGFSTTARIYYRVVRDFLSAGDTYRDLRAHMLAIANASYPAWVGASIDTAWANVGVESYQPPVLLSPIGVITPGTVTFTWQSSCCDDKYRLQVRDEWDNVLVHDDANVPGTATERVVSGIDSLRAYSWRLRPHKDGAWQAPLPWQQFAFIGGVLPAPAPSAPVNGAATGVRPTFMWSQVNGAYRYRIYVRDLATGQWVITKSIFAGPSFTALADLPPGDYEWRIRTLSVADGWGPYSAWQTFTVQ